MAQLTICVRSSLQRGLQGCLLAVRPQQLLQQLRHSRHHWPGPPLDAMQAVATWLQQLQLVPVAVSSRRMLPPCLPSMAALSSAQLMARWDLQAQSLSMHSARTLVGLDL